MASFLQNGNPNIVISAKAGIQVKIGYYINHPNLDLSLQSAQVSIVCSGLGGNYTGHFGAVNKTKCYLN